jgi:hypothetical protein
MMFQFAHGGRMPQQYLVFAPRCFAISRRHDRFHERLFALQQEYDELEVALVEGLPEFPLYLASREHDERRRHERHFSINADFQRWLALAEKIAEIYAARHSED